MHRPEGAPRRARTSTIDTGLQLLAAYDPELAGQLTRKLTQTSDPETRLALRESLAEALFEHDLDEAAVDVLCT